MAIGDDLSITNSKITTLNAVQVLTKATADQTTDATAQTFIYTPTGKHGRVLFIIHQGDASKLTLTLTGGDGVFGIADLEQETPATAGTYILQIETGRFMQSDGTIELEILPDTGKDLVNDHALTVGVAELQ